jgi:hypothetical protein
MRRKLKIEVFQRMTMLGRRWFFRIRAANGEPIAQSEAYHNRLDCEDAAGIFINRDFEIVRSAK